MAHSHGGSDGMAGMDGMGSTDGSTGSTDSMVMTMMAIFQTNIATSLFSTLWTPANVGAYAGTCIFLIVLATIMRGLLAVKGWTEERWLDRELKRRYVVVQGRPALSDGLARDSLSKRMVLSENGVEEDVMVVEKHKYHQRPWRFSVDPVRALLDTIIAGVGYLL